MDTDKQLDQLIQGVFPRIRNDLVNALKLAFHEEEITPGYIPRLLKSMGLLAADLKPTSDGYGLIRALEREGYFLPKDLDPTRPIQSSELEEHMSRSLATRIITRVQQDRSTPTVPGEVTLEELHHFFLNNLPKDGRIARRGLGRGSLLALDAYLRDVGAEQVPFYFRGLPIIETGEEAVPTHFGTIYNGEDHKHPDYVFTGGVRTSENPGLFFWLSREGRRFHFQDYDLLPGVRFSPFENFHDFKRLRSGVAQENLRRALKRYQP